MTDDSLRVTAVAAPVRAEVVKTIRGAILSRRFAPGQRLVERELCELLGVSRTPIREALRQLETEGLVSIAPNKGPIVAEITPAEAAEVYDIRGALESLGARRFAERAPDRDVRRLKERFTALERAVEAGAVAEVIERKDALDEVLIEGAASGLLRQMLGTLQARITFLRAASLANPGRLGESLEEVRAIVAAIERRDANEAAELALRHVELAADYALKRLREEEGDET